MEATRYERRRQETKREVSSLTELEARTQLKAVWLGGDCTKARYRAMLLGLDALRDVEPFRFVGLSGTVFDAALEQDRSKETPHLRTLDRLHLAAMEELRAQRLLTNDGKLASAARALGFDVMEPTAAAGSPRARPHSPAWAPVTLGGPGSPR